MHKVINYRINNDIKADEVRVIDENGENLGVKPLKEAVALAEERGFDLIEIAHEAKPPVAKIQNFDKFRYQKEKEERKRRQAQKNKEMKRVRITPRVAKNDLETKAKKVREFLEAGHRLEIGIFLRGREKANKDFAREKLNEFLEMIDVEFDVVQEIKYSGRGFSTQITKK